MFGVSKFYLSSYKKNAFSRFPLDVVSTAWDYRMMLMLDQVVKVEDQRQVSTFASTSATAGSQSL